MKKHFKKVVIILLLIFTSFLFWLYKREVKKEPFKHSDFYIENIESNEKILNNSKLYNEEYRQFLQRKIQEKEKQKQEQEEEQQQEQEQEEKQERKSKKKKGKERKKKKEKEENGKIKEKTQRARIQRERENNKNDKYIFKKRMKSKMRP